MIAIAIIAFFENWRRQSPIVYSRRQVGRRVYGGQEAHLPLKVKALTRRARGPYARRMARP